MPVASALNWVRGLRSKELHPRQLPEFSLSILLFFHHLPVKFSSKEPEKSPLEDEGTKLA